VEVARRLRSCISQKDHLLVIEAGSAPENFTAPLRRFMPDLVVIIDAADMDETPGTIAWLDWQLATGMSASTHTLPPSVLAKFLVHDMNCRVALLLIQAKTLEFSAPISSEVEAAVTEIVTVVEQSQI
jgi:hydrogenase 3 maturation protease